MNVIKAVVISALQELIEEYRQQKIQFAFAGMKSPVRDLLIEAIWSGLKIEDRIHQQAVQILVYSELNFLQL